MGARVGLGNRGPDQLAEWLSRRLPMWLFLLCAAIFIYRMIVAYRRYLKFDHSFATVLSSQIIVLLLTLNLLLWWCFWRW